jgi:hypothetical protein
MPAAHNIIASTKNAWPSAVSPSKNPTDDDDDDTTGDDPGNDGDALRANPDGATDGNNIDGTAVCKIAVCTGPKTGDETMASLNAAEGDDCKMAVSSLVAVAFLKVCVM